MLEPRTPTQSKGPRLTMLRIGISQTPTTCNGNKGVESGRQWKTFLADTAILLILARDKSKPNEKPKQKKLQKDLKQSMMLFMRFDCKSGNPLISTAEKKR